MPLPAGFLDELKARLPLSAYVGRSVRLARAGREWKGCCPFHQEKSPSFYINDGKAFYHCFGCGVHGDIITFAMQANGLQFPDAVETLAREAGLEVPQRTQESPQQQDARAHLYAAIDAAAAWFASQLYAPAGAKALTYLQQRGLTEDTIAAWRLGYAPDDAQGLRNHLVPKGFTEKELESVGLWRTRDDGSGGYGFFRGRVIFPVTDRRGRTVAFGGRVLDGAPKDAPKYINSPEHLLFKKGELLYGQVAAVPKPQQSRADRLLLVEGYMDVISLAQAGLPAVAPLGTALTEPQLAVLWQLARPRDNARPVLCFDGDNAGRRAAARALALALPQLTPDRTLDFCFLPTGEDPDTLVKARGADALRQRAANAQPLIDTLWEMEAGAATPTTPEARAALEQALSARTAQIGNGALRSHYERDIKDRLWRLFRPAPQSKAAFQPGSGFRPKSPGASTTPAAPLPSLRDPVLAMERTALALLVEFPDLLDEAGGWLLSHTLRDARFAPVFKALTTVAETGDLDADGVSRYLEETCGGGLLSDLRTLAPAGGSFDSARLIWRELLDRQALVLMRDDHRAAVAAFNASGSDADYARMEALRAECATLDERLGAVAGEVTGDAALRA